ncbi:MAG: PIN domain-containing protein [Gemmatimonadota bacterium]
MLVDTSAWIGFFRKKEPYYGTVLQLIDDDRVCCAGLVIGELLQGAKSEKELDVLKNFLHVFEFLPETPRLWKEAGELSYSLRRKGEAVGLSDCLLAVAAAAHGAEILTLDRHFDVLRQAAGVSLTRLKP